MPQQQINLIPTDVVKERTRQSSQTKFMLFCFLLLVVSGVLTAVAGIFATSSSASLTQAKQQVSEKENRLKSLQEIEKSASVLQQRLEFIKGRFDSKVVYSRVLSEIDSKLLTGIAIKSVEVSPDFIITITGISSSTTVLQNYVKNTASKDGFFTDLKILEVKINEGKGTVDFKIESSIDKKRVMGF